MKEIKITLLSPVAVRGDLNASADKLIKLCNEAQSDLIIAAPYSLTGKINDELMAAISPEVSRVLQETAAKISVPTVIGLDDATAVYLAGGSAQRLSLNGKYCNRIKVKGFNLIFGSGIYGVAHKKRTISVRFVTRFLDVPSLAELSFKRTTALAKSAAIVSCWNGLYRNEVGCALKYAAIGGKEKVRSAFNDESVTFSLRDDEFNPPADFDFNESFYSDSPLKPNKKFFPTIYDYLCAGLDYKLREVGTDKIVLGLSGGLDSAFALLTAVKCYDRTNRSRKDIICVRMPSDVSSARTQDNSARLIEAFGVTGLTVPISESVELHLKQLSHDAQDVVYENAQARERAQILMDLANKHNAIVLGTGDLSEIILGWCTYGGDALAHFNTNSSLSKSALRAMIADAAEQSEAGEILRDILATPVSPELLQGQVTEEIIGDYAFHDALTEYFIDYLDGYEDASIDSYFAELKRRFPDYSESRIKELITLYFTRFCRNRFKQLYGCDGVLLFDLLKVLESVPSGYSPPDFISVFLPKKQ